MKQVYTYQGQKIRPKNTEIEKQKKWTDVRHNHQITSKNKFLTDEQLFIKII